MDKVGKEYKITKEKIIHDSFNVLVSRYKIQSKQVTNQQKNNRFINVWIIICSTEIEKRLNGVKYKIKWIKLSIKSVSLLN